MFYLRVPVPADKIILVKEYGKEREDTLFFHRIVLYSSVQLRTGGWGPGCKGGKGRERREDCEKAVFSFCSGKEERKKVSGW